MQPHASVLRDWGDGDKLLFQKLSLIWFLQSQASLNSLKSIFYKNKLKNAMTDPENLSDTSLSYFPVKKHTI